MAEPKKPKTSEDKPFERFQRLVRKVVSVPKTEIDRREAEQRKAKKGR